MSRPTGPPELVAGATMLTAGDIGTAQRVRFETVRPKFGDPPRSTELANWQMFEGMVLALVFTDGSRHFVLGSAVMVAPCTALCASHTVQHLTPELSRGALALAAMGISSHGAQVWSVQRVVSVSRTDLSILTLRIESEIPPNRTFYQAAITTRLPPIGERLVFAGFRASREEFQLTTERTLEIAGAMRLGSGAVSQSFPQGRDRTLVPWPSLEVDAPLFGGMSGGPVFDSRGGLVGLGSRSMEMGIGEEPSPMIVALLWPILGTSFPLASEPAVSASLLDLHGVLTLIERPEAVRVTPAADGLTTTYTAWN